MTTSKIPTEQLFINDRDNADIEILDFADQLVREGKEPRFEVRYPAPKALSKKEKDEWLEKQELVFDAVEVVDGEIRTLPSYEELEAGE
ncbi:hypothetical protein SEA_CECE_169 [Microbacterium phage Cece]|nr:hypothetical protein SEA_CECE_169 [Microbacterium phage Cece]